MCVACTWLARAGGGVWGGVGRGAMQQGAWRRATPMPLLLESQVRHGGGDGLSQPGAAWCCRVTCAPWGRSRWQLYTCAEVAAHPIDQRPRPMQGLGGRVFPPGPLGPRAAFIVSLFNDTGDPMWPDPEDPEQLAAAEAVPAEAYAHMPAWLVSCYYVRDDCAMRLCVACISFCISHATATTISSCRGPACRGTACMPLASAHAASARALSQITHTGVRAPAYVQVQQMFCAPVLLSAAVMNLPVGARAAQSGNRGVDGYWSPHVTGSLPSVLGHVHAGLPGKAGRAGGRMPGAMTVGGRLHSRRPQGCACAAS